MLEFMHPRSRSLDHTVAGSLWKACICLRIS
uniref:Uncharacterized protein n=1 Tax=Rhizophora mucronata TaxID=61149 RepID=A0A2P2N356_RHIMU